MLTRNISRTLFKAIVGFTMAVGCAATMAQPADFNVRFSWKLKGEYGGFYAAQEQGYYEKHGLKVHLGEGAGAQAALGALLQGQEDVVVLPGMFALTAIAKGMPIKLAALYAPKASTILLSFPDKPVKEPKDLEGKVVASAVGEIHTEYLDAFCTINNLDCDKVKRVRVSIQARIPQLIARQVDVAGVQANNDLPMIKKANSGVEFVQFNLADFGLVLPGMAIAVSDKAIADEKKHAQLVAFLQATNEGMDYARKDAQAAAVSMRKLWPGAPDQDIVAEQIEETTKLIPHYEGKPTGWIDEGILKEALNVLKLSKQLEKERPLDAYYTNALLEEASKKAP